MTVTSDDGRTLREDLAPRSRVSRSLTALLLAGLAIGCGDSRERPPVAPEGDERPGTALVRITHPSEGQAILRSAFTTSPGFQVILRGENLREGDQVLLLVFTDEFPDAAVFAAEARVEDGRIPDATRIFLSESTVAGASEAEILVRAFERGGSVAISTDSVGVTLR